MLDREDVLRTTRKTRNHPLAVGSRTGDSSSGEAQRLQVGLVVRSRTGTSAGWGIAVGP